MVLILPSKSSISITLLFISLFCIPLSHAQSFKNAWPNTNFDLADIELGEIMSGGPPRDGIPPVDSPQFDSVEAASEWIAPLEPVISVDINGTAKAYPLQIMTWHEIVNDELNGIPISVTFCPLCNASIVFNRRLDEDILDFGTTGLLRKSDLVMYDRQTESWWQQFTGTAIVGDQLGNVLSRIPSSIISFTSFSAIYPDGEVLNRETGALRSYGRNPYSGYDNINNNPFLFRDKVDSRLPAMERVLGIHTHKHSKIYPFQALQSKPIVQDRIGDIAVLIISSGKVFSALDQRDIRQSKTVSQVTAWQRRLSEHDGVLSFKISDGILIDNQTGSHWNALGTATDGPLKGKQLKPVDSGVHFAFAWLAFNPETTIYGSKD